ncbi:MAG: VIT1/CCC1 transporter family protein [Terriglobales bacterium]
MSDPAPPRSHKELLRLIKDNLAAEREDALMYRRLAAQETDSARRELLEKLAASEDRHTQRWADKLRQFGVPVPPPHLGLTSRLQLWLATKIGTEAAIRRREAGEGATAEKYRLMEQRYGPEAGDVLADIQRDELSHARKLRVLSQAQGPARALTIAMGREHWHRHEHTWLADAIYGANDGLGAVFGIVAGVAGFNDLNQIVLVSGMAGMIASALSMGAGAYLAAKSERELYDAEMSRETREIEENPEEEREELQLFYQLKGFSESEAHTLVARLGEDPAQFLKSMASEELGLAGIPTRRPAQAAWSAGLSTAVGASIPVIPFFFLSGPPAIIWAFAVSLLAHFAVGAAKSLFTNRNWFYSGAEMTLIGLLEAVVTFGVGSLAAHYMGSHV